MTVWLIAGEGQRRIFANLFVWVDPMVCFFEVDETTMHIFSSS